MRNSILIPVREGEFFLSDFSERRTLFSNSSGFLTIKGRTQLAKKRVQPIGKKPRKMLRLS